MARSKRSRKPARRSRARKTKRKAKWARTTTVTRTVKMVRRNPEFRVSADREGPLEYATRRAQETGRAYIVNELGQVMVDCRINRAVFKKHEEKIVFVAKPVRRNPHGRWSTGRFWQRRNVAGMRMKYPIQIPGGIGFLYNDAELRTFLAEAKRLDKARRRGTGW